jgi:hypothetical protein
VTALLCLTKPTHILFYASATTPKPQHTARAAKTADKALGQRITDLATQVGAISLGQPTLTGTTLTIPFTLSDGRVVSRTIDLASMLVGLDIQVSAVAIDANSYNLTITESDGTQNVVNLKSVIEKVVDEKLLPVKDLIDFSNGIANVRHAAITGRLSAAEQANLDRIAQINDVNTQIRGVIGGTINDFDSEFGADTLFGSLQVVRDSINNKIEESSILDLSKNTVGVSSFNSLYGPNDNEDRNAELIGKGTIVLVAGVPYRYVSGDKDLASSYVQIGVSASVAVRLNDVVSRLDTLQVTAIDFVAEYNAA